MLTWNPDISRRRFHLSVLTGRVLACSDSYWAATLKRKRMDSDSFTVLKFHTLGQPWRWERSSKVAWYIHTNSRLWPLLLRSLFMNIIISSCKIRGTCLMSFSIYSMWKQRSQRMQRTSLFLTGISLCKHSLWSAYLNDPQFSKPRRVWFTGI